MEKPRKRCLSLKFPIKIPIRVFMVLFLTVVLTFCQNREEQSFTKGVKYATEGEFKKAKEEFEKTLTVDPTHESAKKFLILIEDINEYKIQQSAAVSLFRGVTNGCKEKWAEAIAEYNKAIEIEPRYAMLYISRGNIYAHKGRYAKAIFDFTKAIEVNPKDAEAYNNRGNAYANKGQYHPAITDQNRPVEINPRLAIAYVDRGLVHMEQLGNKKKACSDWKTACELGECYYYTIAKRKGECE